MYASTFIKLHFPNEPVVWIFSDYFFTINFVFASEVQKQVFERLKSKSVSRNEIAHNEKVAIQTYLKLMNHSTTLHLANNFMEKKLQILLIQVLVKLIGLNKEPWVMYEMSL